MNRDTAIGAAVRAMAARRREEQAAEPVEQPPVKRKRRKAMSTGEKHIMRRSTSILPADQK